MQSLHGSACHAQVNYPVQPTCFVKGRPLSVCHLLRKLFEKIASRSNNVWIMPFPANLKQLVMRKCPAPGGAGWRASVQSLPLSCLPKGGNAVDRYHAARIRAQSVPAKSVAKAQPATEGRWVF